MINIVITHRHRRFLYISHHPLIYQFVPALQQFGEIVDVASDDITPSVVVQFRSRQEAEAAHTRGRQFGDRLLTVNWHTQPAPASAPVVPVGTAGVGGTQTVAVAEGVMKVSWGWGVPSDAVEECWVWYSLMVSSIL